MARTTKQDKVRELQRTLYRAAKADPGRRFHALYDKVHRRDVLERSSQRDRRLIQVVHAWREQPNAGGEGRR